MSASPCTASATCFACISNGFQFPFASGVATSPVSSTIDIPMHAHYNVIGTSLQLLARTTAPILKRELVCFDCMDEQFWARACNSTVSRPAAQLRQAAYAGCGVAVSAGSRHVAVCNLDHWSIVHIITAYCISRLLFADSLLFLAVCGMVCGCVWCFRGGVVWRWTAT